jgi:hypothetical protein
LDGWFLAVPFRDLKGAGHVREESRPTLLREYDNWAKDHPDDATKAGGVIFFTYLQKEDRIFSISMPLVVHGCIYYTGRVKD